MLPALTPGSSHKPPINRKSQRPINQGNILRLMADDLDMTGDGYEDLEELEELELEEGDDFSLTPSAVPLVQLPPEICKGLSLEFFTDDRKKFILKMLANDQNTLFDHQCELLDFVKENQCKAFALTYEACIGAGKTAATLALAGLLPRLHGAKLLYACPSEQRAVRIELGQMFFSATTATSNVHFVFADVRRGELILKYNEHAMKSGQEEVNPIDSHCIILASSEAAMKILTENSDTPFLLFLDEFMTSAGHRNSTAFQCNMELIKVMISRPNPQVILSSATSMGEHAVGMFEQMGFVTKRIQSAKHWATWDMFASASHQWHVHSGCRTRQHVETLDAAMEEPLFARMVSEDSVEDLTKVLPDVEGHSGEVICDYQFSLHRLLEEEEEVIEEICKEKLKTLKPQPLRSDLQNWVDLAGKTSVLLAVNQVDAAIGLFQRDLEYVQGKVAGDAPGSFHTNLTKMNMSKLSKLFRACFFKKEPFHIVWKDLVVGPNERHLNLAILLTAGIGVFTESLHDEWPDYADFVSERAKMGHLHLLIADASVSHGVNFAISRVVLSKSLVEAQPASTVFQLMGRAGRRGFSNEAKILTCELWRQKLMRGLQDGEDLFEMDRANVCEALRSCTRVTRDGEIDISAERCESRERDSEIPGKQETKHGETLYKPRDIEEGSATPEPTWWNSFLASISDCICCCGRR